MIVVILLEMHTQLVIGAAIIFGFFVAASTGTGSSLQEKPPIPKHLNPPPTLSSFASFLQAGATARKRADGVMPSGHESGLKAVAGVHHNVSGM